MYQLPDTDLHGEKICNMSLEEFAERYDMPCTEARQWLRDNFLTEDFHKAWEVCPVGDWLVWTVHNMYDKTAVTWFDRELYKFDRELYKVLATYNVILNSSHFADFIRKTICNNPFPKGE